MNGKFGWMVLLVAAGAADAATFTVTNANDTGAGSLRQAITSANATTTPDIITFNVSQAGVVQISLQSGLPAISQPLVIDGLSQSGGSGPPLVRIDGASAGAGVSGLALSAPNCTLLNCVIQGLQITGFSGSGISVQSNAWTIRLNYIGNDGSLARANAGSGVVVSGTGVVIGGPAVERNVISGNGANGILLSATAANIGIRGNYIGLTASGANALPNGSNGVRVLATAGQIDIGGINQTEGNVISGNTGDGIGLDTSSLNTRVRANRIGTTSTGTAAVPNGGAGINIGGGAHQIGGNSIAARNQISGNAQIGMVIGNLTGIVTVQGNYIGSNGAGTAAIPNGAGGIRVLSTGGSLVIGGANSNEGNLISGNSVYGISLDEGTSEVSVLGNRIGTSADGNAALPNQGAGISVSGSNHTIGVGAARNLISGNSGDGIDISGVATNATVLGNYVGTNAGGSAALGNGGSGIRVLSASAGIRIGDSGSGQGNLISGNLLRGLTLDASSNGVLIAGNRIGSNADGTAAIGNVETGIFLNGNNHVIGGNSAGARNLISGNAGNGIIAVGGGGGSSIRGNYIGTNAAGNAALANTAYGIRAAQTSSLNIGGSAAGSGNLISGNARGMSIEAVASHVTVAGNILGLNAAANAVLPNGSDADTITITGPDATIGGTLAGAGNIIAGNQNTAISVRLASATNAIIQGNWIGTNPALAPNLGNQFIGILIDRADGVLIGGTAVGAGNVIANNGFFGILAENGTGNSVLGNAIYGNAPLQLDIAEQGPESNDPLDPDSGGNFRQNFPIIHSAAFAGGNIALVATLASKPSQDYRIEFFQAAACSPAGLGGANLALGAQIVTTDASGNATANLSVPAANANGVVTAIATAADGSSSEFSPCHSILGPNPGRFQIWRNPVLGYEGIATMKVIVVRSHGNQGVASVQLSTLDDSATSPADYQAVNTTLSFADGEVMRSIEIPIAVDALNEGQEQFTLQLSNPSGGATLGTLAAVPAIIIESPVPFYSVSDGMVIEPVSGTALISFTISLSPNDTARSIEYFTEDATASTGSDYLSTAGMLNFPASATTQSQTVTVPVLADVLTEPQESFYLRIAATGNIAFYDGVGEGTILPPGSALPDGVFEDGFE